jgi:hypothetical protein
MPKKKSPSSKTTKPQRANRKAASAGGALPPYGVPIREAIARGDVREMRQVAASTRKWLKDVQAALDRMEKSMKDLES